MHAHACCFAVWVHFWASAAAPHALHTASLLRAPSPAPVKQTGSLPAASAPCALCALCVPSRLAGSVLQAARVARSSGRCLVLLAARLLDAAQRLGAVLALLDLLARLLHSLRQAVLQGGKEGRYGGKRAVKAKQEACATRCPNQYSLLPLLAAACCSSLRHAAPHMPAASVLPAARCATAAGLPGPISLG